MDREAPPGQRWIDQPIVYDIAPVPPMDLAAFRLRLRGEVERPMDLEWEDLRRLPRIRVTRDMHCVTYWSVPAIEWEGIATRELIDRVRPSERVRWVIARGREGYSTNVPWDAFTASDSLIADRMGGRPLAAEHGAPLRLVVPTLYAWKSAKYLVDLEFRADLVRGTWERVGYHDRGDPWREERFRELGEVPRLHAAEAGQRPDA